jgi:cysteine desulfurase
MDSIYLDSSASTAVLPAVWEAMRPYLIANPANPASTHHIGRQARQALETAREQIAGSLGAHPDEVVFTSGATEANNLALFGQVGKAPGRVLGSQLEHPCVLEPLLQLSKRGFEVEYLPVEPTGVLSPSALNEKDVAGVCLFALMLANHETGAVQAVRELFERLPRETAKHCDAAAAAGKMAIDFHKLGATTLTLSAHKFHGPKGVGALLVRQGAKLQPLWFGGHQQRGRRPGTEPVALAVGMAEALSLAYQELEQRRQKIGQLRQAFLHCLKQGAEPVVVNGPEQGGLPHVLNLSFPGCQADVLLMKLDLAGICCSTGSACSSGSLLPSPVLRAMGVPAERLRSAMRFSFSHLLTEKEVVEAARRVVEVVGQLRSVRWSGLSG